jgi:hypothetical protein
MRNDACQIYGSYKLIFMANTPDHYNMPHTARSLKRKLDEVDGTPPVSTTQTKTETVGMDGDTTIVGPGEEKTENCGSGVKKKKKLAERKCKCLVDGCNRSFHIPSKLQHHVDFTHNGIYHNVCDHIDEETGAKCGYKCEQPCNLESHKRNKHSDVCDHKCTDCTKTFKTVGQLDIHCVIKHSPPDDPRRTQHKCELCNHKGFPTSGDLTSHHLYNHIPKDDPRLAALRKASAASGRRSQLKKRAKESAERAAFWALKGVAPSAFGQSDGVSRDDAIKAMIVQMMGSLAGLHHHRGTPTIVKWVKRHGCASLRDVLSNHTGNRTFAAYFFQTRQIIKPGEEEKCNESFEFLHHVQRDPLWRIETGEGDDLRRFTYSEAKSVCQTYVLGTSDNPYDITSLEAEAQNYIEDLGAAHGVRLHKKAGAGSRLPGSETEQEKKLRAEDGTIIYSLAVTLIETHDQVFADELDPNDPTPTIPRLLSAKVKVGIKNGIKTDFKIIVRGHKKPFRDAPQVLLDRNEVKRIQKQNRAVTKVRHAARKPATTTPNQGTDDCIQEPSNKKQKMVAV